MLGRHHESVMGKQTDGQRKIAALNLKSLLTIFSAELDKIIKPVANAMGPQSQPDQPVNPGIQPDGGDDPMIEPALPVDEPVLGQKQSSGFDMSMLDDQALEEQKRLMEQIQARQAVNMCKFCDKGI